MSKYREALEDVKLVLQKGIRNFPIEQIKQIIILQELVDKETPKKRIPNINNDLIELIDNCELGEIDIKNNEYYCPTCHKQVLDYQNICENCKQSLEDLGE